MKWTNERPTEPGWYWWRKYREGESSPARIMQRGDAYWHGVINDNHIIRPSEGEWWSEKIEPPESG